MKDLVTRGELAKHFKVSERTLRRVLAGMPGLPCLRVGRQVLFAPGDVARIEREFLSTYTPTIPPGLHKRRFMVVGSPAGNQQAALLKKMQDLREKAKAERMRRQAVANANWKPRE